MKNMEKGIRLVPSMNSQPYFILIHFYLFLRLWKFRRYFYESYFQF